MDTTKEIAIKQYLQENKIGVIMRYGRRQFAVLTTGEKFTIPTLVGKMNALGIETNSSEIESIQNTSEVKDIVRNTHSTPPINEIVTQAMEGLGMVIASSSGLTIIRIEQTILTVEEASTMLSMHAENEMDVRVSKEKVADYLKSISHTNKVIEGREFKEAIKTDPSLTPESAEMAEKLMRIVCGPDYLPIHNIIIRHIIWLIKRRHELYPPQEILYPIFVNLYSQLGNTGKSSFWEAFFKIIPLSYRKNENHLDDLINDERKMFSLMNNLVVICGELGNLDKTSVEKLKSVIDMYILSFRQLGFNSDAAGPNHATMVGTSNFPLSDKLHGGPNPRKWIELPFHYYGSTQLQHNTSYLPLQNFDYIRLWKSVDEKQPSPLQPKEVYDEFLALAAKVCGSSETYGSDEFFKDFIMEHMNQCRDFGFTEIFNRYKEVTTSYRVSYATFSKLLTKAGFTRIYKSHGRRWTCPSFTTSPLFTDEERETIEKQLDAEQKVKEFNKSL